MNRDKRERFYRKIQKRDEAFNRWLNNNPDALERLGEGLRAFSNGITAIFGLGEPIYISGGYTSVPISEHITMPQPEDLIQRVFSSPGRDVVVLGTYPEHDPEKQKAIDKLQQEIFEKTHVDKNLFYARVVEDAE